MSIPRDVRDFLDEYPGNSDNRDCSDNLDFYSGTLPCRPDRLLINEIHDRWLGDYDKLEHKHGFIQWLFPIREYGMNYESMPLQPHEIDLMKSNPQILERVLSSYRLMLDFYGMRLVSSETGLIERSLPPRNYEARYRNLVRSSHNYLRISRILKCLSELGFERLNSGFLLHVLNEQSEWDELNSQGIRSSMDRWWANCIRNKEERARVGDLIKQVRSGAGGFVFTREMYREALGGRPGLGNSE